MGSCPSMRTWLGRSTKSSLAALSRGVNLFVVLARTAVQDLTPCCRKVSFTRDGQYSANWSRGWSRGTFRVRPCLLLLERIRPRPVLRVKW